MKRLLNYLGLTSSQRTVQHKAVALLQRQGHITLWEIQQLGTTSASKLVTRIRRQGYINGHIKQPNAHGRGFHHQYIWSGKVA